MEAEWNAVTSNVFSTIPIALLMLPQLRETGSRFSLTPGTTIMTSEMHFMTKFPGRRASNTFEALNDIGKADMNDRSLIFLFHHKTSKCYLFFKRNGITKLIKILLVRHLAPMLGRKATENLVSSCNFAPRTRFVSVLWTKVIDFWKFDRKIHG